MIDLTPVINAVIALIGIVITVFLIPWLKSKYTAQQIDDMLKWVNIAVTAAEQLLATSSGQAKKEYVLKFLEEKGYAVDQDEIDKAIESAVHNMNIALKSAEILEQIYEADIIIEDK